jgi:hypothetical protein
MVSERSIGAADAYTILGALVLFLFSWTQMIIPGYNQMLAGNIVGIINIALGVVLVTLTIIAFIASEFVKWTIPRSGQILVIFGFAALFITLQGLNFNLLAWLSNVGPLGALMLIIAGVLKWFG